MDARGTGRLRGRPEAARATELSRFARLFENAQARGEQERTRTVHPDCPLLDNASLVLDLYERLSARARFGSGDP